MNILVVVYSRTGRTRAVGRTIAHAFGDSLQEIRDVRSRRGPFGYLRSAMEASRRRTPAIEPFATDLSAYDLVILGTPVWAGHMAAPMRTFLEQHKLQLGRIAAFCTLGGSGAPRTLAEIAEVAGQAPVAQLALRDAEIETDAGQRKIDDFIDAVHARVATDVSRAAL